MRPAVMWFRRDLRLADNPALLEAVAAGSGQVTGLFVLDPVLWDAAGPARRARLVGSLRQLDRAMNGRLVIRRGDPVEVVPTVAAELDAPSVHIAADFGPYGRRRDVAVEQALDCPLSVTGSPYAIAPGRITNQQGKPYHVFTPWYRAWVGHGWHGPVDPPERVAWVQLEREELPETEPVEEAGEDASRERWAAYLEELAGYQDVRDRPGPDATSHLSVPLKYGEIHPRTMLADLARNRGDGAAGYRRELAWREFCADLLARYPEAAWKPIRPEFERMRYDEPGELFDAWRTGRTGYPIVDAGMRQLAETGFMHNRVRMVVASFLVKDLHVHWKYGARWFMRQLADGDLASNSLNWQWVAGCGVDAAPYFRIFNPTTQGQKFDPDGTYVRRWVPELRTLSGNAAHEPWKHAGADDYPDRVVDHAEAREEALRRYAALKG